MDSPEQKNKKVHACPFNGCSAIFNRPYRLAQHRLVHVNIVSSIYFKIPKIYFKHLILISFCNF